MVAHWIHKVIGVLWPMALMRVIVSLTTCLLIGALAPTAVAALGHPGVAQASTTVATAPGAQPATYRSLAQADGTTEVQRSQDGGLTWPAVGLIPELVAQLAVNPSMAGCDGDDLCPPGRHESPADSRT